MFLEMKDYYEILEVHPKASQEVIKKAYQTLVKKYHPDVTAYENGFAHEKLTELNEAYSVLSDSERRGEYDKQFLKDTLKNEDIIPPTASSKKRPMHDEFVRENQEEKMDDVE